MRKILVVLCTIGLPFLGFAQHTISGSVFNAKGNSPLPGAVIKAPLNGNAVVSDVNGLFSIVADSAEQTLITTFVGFMADTLKITSATSSVTILLKEGKQLGTVTVKGNDKSTYVSGINPIKTQVMTEDELEKAPCCNLSESFETNPSVDVNYGDAVTGTRQIQMLGLSGVYSPVQVENIPYSRGLAATSGLGFIPGPWIESIQVSKGAGSVVNGYESTTGLINVELKKPESSEKLYLNGYVNSMIRSEGNLNLAKRIDSAWSTGLLLHFDGWQRELDMNGDGFMEMPLSTNYALVNRWKYQGKRGFESMFGIKAIYDRRSGGQLGFRPKDDKLSTQTWGFDMQTQRYEVFAKNGYVFPNLDGHSIGTIISATYHKQNNFFGLRTLNQQQRSLYANFIYQGEITEKQTFKTGLSFLYDNISETFVGQDYLRKEIVPGAFLEYTYNNDDRFVVVAGGRADYHNLFGLFFTPRLHIKYNVTELFIVRLSGGRGQRTAGVFADNMGLLANNRQWVINGNGGQAYGLQPEVAWNYGANLTWGFFIGQRDATFSLDFYRSDFMNQIVVDMENPQLVQFYNLQGSSYSNSTQAQFDFQPLERFDVRVAYRYFDVKTQYTTGLLQRPFVAKHRAFINLGYKTLNEKWKFDFTAQWFGPKRIPSTTASPEVYQMPVQSPNYFILNAQVSRTFNRWDVYVGAENLTNFHQHNLIIDSQNPFGQYFDASLVWGPTIGRMFYAGFRFKIDYE
jgi:outer membrane receptor for ferrienterochelin and colicin